MCRKFGPVLHGHQQDALKAFDTKLWKIGTEATFAPPPQILDGGDLGPRASRVSDGSLFGFQMLMHTLFATGRARFVHRRTRWRVEITYARLGEVVEH